MARRTPGLTEWAKATSLWFFGSDGDSKNIPNLAVDKVKSGHREERRRFTGQTLKFRGKHLIQDKPYFILDGVAIPHLYCVRLKSASNGSIGLFGSFGSFSLIRWLGGFFPFIRKRGGKVPSGLQWRLALGMHSVQDAIGVSEGFLFYAETQGKFRSTSGCAGLLPAIQSRIAISTPIGIADYQINILIVDKEFLLDNNALAEQPNFVLPARTLPTKPQKYDPDAP